MLTSLDSDNPADMPIHDIVYSQNVFVIEMELCVDGKAGYSVDVDKRGFSK